LGVSERTIRRYAVALHDLGIPVDGQPGLGGGYRLRPGVRLPPLMLSDEEAAAVVFGLVLAE
jgi:predicted DNA-binding transcriptional regulator YafY